MAKKKAVRIRIKPEDVKRRPRSAILPSQKIRDKSKYTRKKKHPKKDSG